jgi:hypothetical protein
MVTRRLALPAGAAGASAPPPSSLTARASACHAVRRATGTDRCAHQQPWPARHPAASPSASRGPGGLAAHLRRPACHLGIITSRRSSPGQRPRPARRTSERRRRTARRGRIPHARLHGREAGRGLARSAQTWPSRALPQRSDRPALLLGWTTADRGGSSRPVCSELPPPAVAGDSDVSHSAAAPGGFPGRLADARLPAQLRLAGPQLMTDGHRSSLLSNWQAASKRSCPGRLPSVNGHRDLRG